MSRRHESYDDDDEGDGDGYVHELRNDDGKKKTDGWTERSGDTSDGKMGESLFMEFTLPGGACLFSIVGLTIPSRST